MNKYTKLIKNSLIFAIGSLGSKVIMLLMVPLYTYFLSTTEYGIIDLATTLIGLLIPIISLNIMEAVFRFTIDKDEDNIKVLNTSLVVCFIGFIITITFYPLIHRVYNSRGIVLSIYFILLLQAIQGVFKQYVRAKEEMVGFILSDIGNTLTFTVLNVALLGYFRLGIEAYFYSLIIAYIVDICVLSYFGKILRDINFKFFDKNCFYEMIKFCMPMLPNAIMLWIISVSDRLIISNYLGLASTGIYGIANKFPSILFLVNGIFSKSWQISAVEQNDKEGIEKFYEFVFDIYSTIMIISSSILILFIKPLMYVAVSSEFFIGWRYTPLLLLGTVFGCFSNFFSSIFIASKKTKAIFYSSCIAATVNIALNILLIPSNGIQGACVATFISYFIMWMIRVINSKKIISFNIGERKLLSGIIILLLQVITLLSDLNKFFMYFVEVMLLFGILLINRSLLSSIIARYRMMKQSQSA